MLPLYGLTYFPEITVQGLCYAAAPSPPVNAGLDTAYVLCLVREITNRIRV